jgi:serine phosphatase RsbU (regulator of sigma subunit)
LPVLTLFYQMAPEDTALGTIVGEINQHLRDSMPIGRFVGLVVACVDTKLRSGEIWVGGMPDAVLLDESGQEISRFCSRELPLGIVDTSQIDVTPAVFNWQCPCQLVLCSDGLLEAEDDAGEQFGEARLIAAMMDAQQGGRRDAVQEALTEHLGSTCAKDDISLLLVSCPTN